MAKSIRDFRIYDLVMYKKPQNPDDIFLGYVKNIFVEEEVDFGPEFWVEVEWFDPFIRHVWTPPEPCYPKELEIVGEY